MCQSSCCCISSPASGVVSILYFHHSNSGCTVVISHFCFNLHFPNDRWCWTCLFTICVFSLVRFWFLKLGCFSLLSLEHSLCILDTYPLSDMSFAKIFSQFVGCLFILLAASFTEKFFNVIKYIQITFCFFGFFFNKSVHCLYTKLNLSSCINVNISHS